MGQHTSANTCVQRYLITSCTVTVPTVGDAIDTLNHILEDLTQTLKQFLDFSAELATQDHALENIPEVRVPFVEKRVRRD